eukprot:GILI01031116.1.p1 GENE.GILI01031116.1~~GILI01031116.1.p1  ORF type:complete len:164 (+),score=22.74 GILI01031116.1:49-540(+)
MLRKSTFRLNTYFGRDAVVSPASVIRSGTKFFTEPERLIKQKLLFFTLGIDQQPLRRVALLANEDARLKASPRASNKKDVTGFRKARGKQSSMWYRRMKYQEYYLEHIFTRYAWSVTRKYPTNGVKLPGVAEDGYFGDAPAGVHYITRQALPIPIKPLYEPRK